jgi:diaminopimelate decarboxylase
VLVDGNRFATILPRPSVAELIAMDHVPDWI